jgi:hypothetical protein
MHLFYYVLFYFFVTFQRTFANSAKMNYNHNVRNLSFKFIIFKEKKYPKILNIINNKSKIYYDKAISFVNDQFNYYENLSPEEKHIIEFMFSMLL